MDIRSRFKNYKKEKLIKEIEDPERPLFPLVYLCNPDIVNE